MNVRVTLIALSLVANVALGAAWLTRRPASAPTTQVAPEPTRVPGPIPLTLNKEAWRRLADADDRTFVARLREQGFPPAVVRALASARIATRYAKQMRALRTKAPTPYWRGPAYSGSLSNLDAEGRAELRRINREQAEQLRALVGDEGAVRTWYESAFQSRNYRYLPPEKGEALRAIQNDYRELRAQVWDRAKGVMLAEDRRMQAYLDQQERADMAKVLSAEELAEYDLRSSPSATMTRSRLQNFEPTEAEFRALVKLQLAFDAQIESDDLDTLVARLRAAGFPAREVQEIARTVLMTRSQQRRKAVQSPAEDPPYWRSLAFGPQDREAEEKANAVSREFAPLWRKLEKLVRVPLPEDADAADRARERYGNLPLEKLQRAQDIEAAFEDRVLALSAEGQANMQVVVAQGQANAQVVVAQGQAYAQIKAEQDAALRAALSPEEYREYALRSSPTAMALRSRLALFQPTEAEYQALFDLFEPIDRQIGGFGLEQRAPWRAAEAQLTSQIEAALGPERYADFVQAQQSGGDKLSRLMARLELPLSTIGHLNSIRDDITQRAQSIRANPQLTAAERAQQLSGLAKEAATRLGAKLGDRGLSAYRDLKGDWLLDLEKR